MRFSLIESMRQLRDYDQRRPGFAGEHWLALGAGVAVMMAARRSASPLKRGLGMALGSAMLARAASGRDGLAALADKAKPRA